MTRSWPTAWRPSGQVSWHTRMAGLVLAAAALAAPGAWAQTDPATAEMLMKKSGLWEQLASMTPQVRNGMLAAMAKAPTAPTPAETERLSRAAEAAYAPDRLRGLARAVIAETLAKVHVPAIQAWYDTPTAAGISKLEEADSADTADMGIRMQAGNAALEAMPSTRRALLGEMVLATRSAEFLTTITVNTALATFKGATSVRPNPAAPSEEQMKAMLQAQRPQMLQAFSQVALAGFARVYAPVAMADLTLYANFLKSDAGRHFNDVTARAFEAAIVDAATELGRRLPTTSDKANS